MIAQVMTVMAENEEAMQDFVDLLSLLQELGEKGEPADVEMLVNTKYRFFVEKADTMQAVPPVKFRALTEKADKVLLGPAPDR